jgi:hypothetical protein
MGKSGIDWSADGVGWQDSSTDIAMAADWLENERLYPSRESSNNEIPHGYDMNLEARVDELVQTDLDPERGWRLVNTLIRMAANEDDRWNVAAGPLAEFVRLHGDAFYEEIDEAAKTNTDFRWALTKTLAGWPGEHRPVDH